MRMWKRPMSWDAARGTCPSQACVACCRRPRVSAAASCFVRAVALSVLLSLVCAAAAAASPPPACASLSCLPSNDAAACSSLQSFCQSAGGWCAAATRWQAACSGTPTDYCDFAGVGCAEGVITSLNLSASGLTGAFPSVLAALPSLTYLNLACNELAGSIPGSAFLDLAQHGLITTLVDWPIDNASTAGLALGYQGAVDCPVCSPGSSGTCSSLSADMNVYSALQLQMLLANPAPPVAVVLQRHLSLAGACSLTDVMGSCYPLAGTGSESTNITGNTSACLAAAALSDQHLSVCTLDLSGAPTPTRHLSVTSMSLVLRDVGFSGGSTTSWPGGGSIWVLPTAELRAYGCIFTGNSATSSGGALFADTTFFDASGQFLWNCAPGACTPPTYSSPGTVASVAVYNCTFDSNDAQTGGAVFAWMHFTSVDSLYVNNVSPSPSSSGPAICTSFAFSQLVLHGNTYTSNIGGPLGGVHNVAGSLDSQNETYVGNSGNDGGALFLQPNMAFAATSVVINGARFVNNSATWNASFLERSTSSFNSGNGGAIWSIQGFQGFQPVIINSHFEGNFAQNGGGAVFSDSLNATGCTFTGNTAAAIPPYATSRGGGGAIQMSGNTPSYPSPGSANSSLANAAPTISGCTFANNTSPGEGGAVRYTFYAGVSAPSAPIVAILNSTFINQAAASGGAVAVQGATLVATRLQCLANSAAQGGCVFLATGSLLSAAGVYERNAASAAGGAIYVAADVAYSSTSDSFTLNSASEYGGAVYSNAESLSFARIEIMSGNTAPVGAGVFSPSPLANFSLTCDANIASNYGCAAATLPQTLQSEFAGADLLAQSGVPFGPAFVLLDQYSQTVGSWADLSADVRCVAQLASAAGPCAASALAGDTHSTYASSQLAFPTLSAVGDVGQTLLLQLKVTSASIPALAAGATIAFNVTIAPCDAMQTFVGQRCICAVGSFLNSTTLACEACPLGSQAPTPGAAACVPNPPRVASVTQTTVSASLVLAGIAASLGPTIDAALAQAIAASLGVSSANVTVVAAAHAAGRRLLQSSLNCSFSVTTTAPPAVVLGLLNTSLAASLAAMLAASGDVALAALSPANVSVGPALVSALVLSHPCPEDSVTSPSNPAQCACTFGYYDALFGASLLAPACTACPLGGVCTTGFVGAGEGYWRNSTLSGVFYRCREGRCREEEVLGGPLSGAANASSVVERTAVSTNSTTCVEGAGGPLCALCLPGYAMQSGVCSPCSSSSAWSAWSDGDKAALLACCVVFALALITFGLFLPLLPFLERRVNYASSSLSEYASRLLPTGRKVAAPADSVEAQHANALYPQNDDCADAGRVDAVHPRDDNCAAAVPMRAAMPLHALRSNTQHHFGSRRLRVGARASARLFSQRLVLDTLAMPMPMDKGDDDDFANVQSRMERVLEMLDGAEEMLEPATKIITNFYQIVSTFMRSLDVPWPHVFGTVMARVSVVNLNLVQLPKTACLNPNPSYYSAFNGYTLGLLFFAVFLGALRLFGTHALARFTSDAERAERVERFNHRLLKVFLLVLYIVYPGVSVAIFGIFSCTRIGNVWLLDADANIVCFSPKHSGYLAAGVIWVFVFTVGIPCFFIWLLHHFRVPHLARQLADNAWLRELVKLAWLEGMPQPAEQSMASLTTDSITDLHLEALNAFFLRGVSLEQASNILLGESEPLADPKEDAPPPPPSRLRRLMLTAWRRARAAWLEKEPVANARRAELLSRLLRWAKTTGVIAIPIMDWEEDDKDDVAPEAAHRSRAGAEERRVSKVKSTETQAQQRLVALQKVGFLFEEYRPDVYYWEVVELLRKLALTSILALIAPGTAGQVVVGLLLALFMLLLTLHLKPHTRGILNSINAYAQLNLLLFLLVALLLKVNLDERGGDYFYTGIVGFLALAPLLLPFHLLISSALAGEGAEGAVRALAHAHWEE